MKSRLSDADIISFIGLAGLAFEHWIGGLAVLALSFAVGAAEARKAAREAAAGEPG